LTIYFQVYWVSRLSVSVSLARSMFSRSWKNKVSWGVFIPRRLKLAVFRIDGGLQAIIGLVSLAVMFIVAITVFHIKIIAIMRKSRFFGVWHCHDTSIGLAIGGWAKTSVKQPRSGISLCFRWCFCPALLPALSDAHLAATRQRLLTANADYRRRSLTNYRGSAPDPDWAAVGRNGYLAGNYLHHRFPGFPLGIINFIINIYLR